RKRTRATAEQLAVLENTFAVTVSPNAKLRKQLSERLKMSERSIQIWFQNRRAKVKHMQKRAQQQQQQQRVNMFWRAQSVDSTLFHQQPPFAFTNPAVSTSDMMMMNNNMRPMSMPPPAIQPTPSNMMLPSSSSPTLIENLYILSATTLTIGTWQRLALHVTDLMLTFAQDVFAWHIYDNGLQFKIHIPLSTVAGITQEGEQVHLDLTEPPLFYMMTAEQDGKQSQRWVPCSDFSEGQQASQCLRHTIKGASEQLKQDLFALS
ncbi:homeobox-domain-containing protein, partial [Lichtheimia hyalospora FSU 10163]